MTLFSSAGAMVERLFFKYYYNKTRLFQTSQEEKKLQKDRNTPYWSIVKAPLQLHKNIVVLDFRSYHISMMSYNISQKLLIVLVVKKQMLLLATTYARIKEALFQRY